MHLHNYSIYEAMVEVHLREQRAIAERERLARAFRKPGKLSPGRLLSFLSRRWFGARAKAPAAVSAPAKS